MKDEERKKKDERERKIFDGKKRIHGMSLLDQ